MPSIMQERSSIPARRRMGSQFSKGSLARPDLFSPVRDLFNLIRAPPPSCAGIVSTKQPELNNTRLVAIRVRHNCQLRTTLNMPDSEIAGDMRVGPFLGDFLMFGGAGWVNAVSDLDEEEWN